MQNTAEISTFTNCKKMYFYISASVKVIKSLPYLKPVTSCTSLVPIAM